MRRALNKLLEDDDWEAGVEVIRAQIRRGDRAAMQMAAGYLGEVIVTKGESGGPGDFEIGLDEARKVLRLGSKRRRQNAG